MRNLFIWLLALGIIAGLHARVLAEDPCEIMAECHEHSHDAPCHGDPCDSDHDGKCPAEHHHHQGCVCPVMPLIPNTDSQMQLGCASSTLSRRIEQRRRIPEGPVLGMDKPPLV